MIKTSQSYKLTNTNTWKKILIFFFSLSLFLASSFFFYFIAEKFFFDRLFYRKSIRHGYYNFWPYYPNDWQVIADRFNFDHRNTDLLNLVNAAMGDSFALEILEKEQKKDLFKVALIGDSMFFGTGVRKNQTLAYFLERELNKELPSKVYNYSFNGNDILDNYIKYQLADEYLQPDLMILGLVENDLIFDQLTNYPFKKIVYLDLTKHCTEKELILYDRENDHDSYLSRLKTAYYPSFGEDTQNFCLLKNVADSIDPDKTILLSYGCPVKIDECQDTEEKLCLEKDLFYRYHSVFLSEFSIINHCDIAHQFVSAKETHPNVNNNRLLAKKVFVSIKEKYDW